MTRAATMGSSSCAAIAIAHFKGQNYEDNVRYLESGEGSKGEGLSVDEFYTDIIYPTEQPLGHTAEYPFDMLMDHIDKSRLKTKFIIATLNQSQMMLKDGYWPKRLKERGFEPMDKTKNDIGQPCVIFVRNNNRMPLDEGDKE